MQQPEPTLPFASGETPELPIQSDRAQGCGSRDSIIGDVIDLECAGIFVAQYQPGISS